MKRYAISGTWMLTNAQVKQDVKNTVGEIINEGNGILSGGALGVDYIATEVVLNQGNISRQLRLYLPVKINNFCDHYVRRSNEGVITSDQAKKICEQLKTVYTLSKRSIIHDTDYQVVNKESYYARNTSIIENCSVLCAFQVNDSQGIQDAIDKAKILGKEVRIKKYSIEI